jgi:hypothetical protein
MHAVHIVLTGSTDQWNESPDMPTTNRSRREAIRRLGALSFGGSLGLGAPVVLLAESPNPVPEVLGTNLVRTTSSGRYGRPCLAVELTDEVQARERAAPGGNPPSYAIVHRDFSDGVIEIDIAGELTGKGGPDARGFVGLAFHINADLSTYEAVYLRMSNGRLNDPKPPAPRIDRAIQYVAHPDFHFNVSREKFPGRYERGAAIALGRWQRLRLEIQGARARALVDGDEALVVDDLRYAGRRGPVGLWVGDGSRGLFRQLSVLGA